MIHFKLGYIEYLGVHMVIAYLEKIKHELDEQKYQHLHQLSNLEIQLKENTRFIQLLEESSDPNFEDFSPREVNPYQKVKIKEMKEEQKEILISIEATENSIRILNEKIEEISKVLDVARETYNS